VATASGAREQELQASKNRAEHEIQVLQEMVQRIALRARVNLAAPTAAAAATTDSAPPDASESDSVLVAVEATSRASSSAAVETAEEGAVEAVAEAVAEAPLSVRLEELKAAEVANAAETN
jgi:hypothetical protein